MTAEAVKAAIWPALVGAVLSTLSTGFYFHFTLAQEMTKLTTVIEMYVPATERRIMNNENLSAINDKRIDFIEVQLAKLDK